MQEKKYLEEGIRLDIIEKIFKVQNRCTECGGTYALHIHHRIFKSEIGRWSEILTPLLENFYEKTQVRLPFWHINDIQNLVVLCRECHEGNITGIHGGNEQLRIKYRESFTHPITCFNIKLNK